MGLQLSFASSSIKKYQKLAVLRAFQFYHYWAIFTLVFWFFENFGQNRYFQALLQKKLKLLLKKLPRLKMCKMFRKIYFFSLEVAKTTSRCYFEGKSTIKKNRFFYLWEIYFSSQGQQALEKYFFQNILKNQALSFHTHFQVLKNIKNWLF